MLYSVQLFPGHYIEFLGYTFPHQIGFVYFVRHYETIIIMAKYSQTHDKLSYSTPFSFDNINWELHRSIQ